MWYLIVSIPDLCTLTYFATNIQMAVLPKVRSALCAASQLPGEGLLMWKMLLHLHVNQKPMMMMSGAQLVPSLITVNGCVHYDQYKHMCHTWAYCENFLNARKF